VGLLDGNRPFNNNNNEERTVAIRLTESRLRQIIREETRRLIRRRIIREGEEGGTLELRFGQPELDVYEESLEITFPYTLGDESDEEKVTYGDL
jgi:hypothetical protein